MGLSVGSSIYKHNKRFITINVTILMGMYSLYLTSYDYFFLIALSYTRMHLRLFFFVIIVLLLFKIALPCGINLPNI